MPTVSARGKDRSARAPFCGEVAGADEQAGALSLSLCMTDPQLENAQEMHMGYNKWDRLSARQNKGPRVTPAAAW